MRITPLFAVLLTVQLTACNAKMSHQANQDSAMVVPEIKVADFQQVPCDRVWQAGDEQSYANVLYWLRAMDCAMKLSPADARAEAGRWPGDNWHNAFKQGVLMANGNVTPTERRDYLQKLDSFSQDYPATVREVIQLWHADQMGQLQLSEERTRYQHLQQNSDAQLDILRQQQASLTKELNVTRHKLETLTDIERQLSSRRSPDSADNSHVDKRERADTGGASPGNNTKDRRQP